MSDVYLDCENNLFNINFKDNKLSSSFNYY